MESTIQPAVSARRGWLAALALLVGALAVYRLTRPRQAAPASPQPTALPPSPPVDVEQATLVLPLPATPPEPDPDDVPTAENALPIPVISEPRRVRTRSPRSLPWGALAALIAGLAAYDVWADNLPDVSLWWQVAVVGLLVIPATFGLVWLALPARQSRYLPAAVVVLAGLAVVLEAADLRIAANFAKLAAITAAGWFFLRFFEDVSWVLLVAVLIVPVDIYSVAHGPTKHILTAQPGVFDRLSISFPVPGAQSSAQLGLPDVLFFALFLGAADRFGLRPRLTWLLCTLSFGATLALTVGFDVTGLPALPLLSAGFVLANGDLLWARLRWRKLA